MEVDFYLHLPTTLSHQILFPLPFSVLIRGMSCCSQVQSCMSLINYLINLLIYKLLPYFEHLFSCAGGSKGFTDTELASGEAYSLILKKEHPVTD